MLLMRLVDLMISVPQFFVMLLLVVVLQPGAWVVVLVVSLFGWPYPARVFRSQILSLKEADFVLAARALGVPERRIFLRHVLPHLLPLVTVYFALSMPGAIFAEASLSFLGLGVPPPTPVLGLDDPGWTAVLPRRALVGALSGARHHADGRLLQPGGERSARGDGPRATRTVTHAGRTSSRRLLWIAITLWGVSMLTFGMLFAGPTDAARALSGARAQAASVEMLRQRLGLDRPLHEQYLTYLGNLMRGDLGDSYYFDRPVADALRERFPATAQLAADHLRPGGRARCPVGRHLGGPARRCRSTGA